MMTGLGFVVFLSSLIASTYAADEFKCYNCGNVTSKDKPDAACADPYKIKDGKPVECDKTKLVKGKVWACLKEVKTKDKVTKIKRACSLEDEKIKPKCDVTTKEGETTKTCICTATGCNNAEAIRGGIFVALASLFTAYNIM